MTHAFTCLFSTPISHAHWPRKNMTRNDNTPQCCIDPQPARKWPLWLSIALFMAVTGTAQSAETFARIDHARIRWLPNDLPLAGYFDLGNTGTLPLVLTGASSEAFGGVMMHRTVHNGGETRMLAAPNFAIKPGQTLHFAPDGYHLMLMSRTRKLVVGDHVPIRLEFSGGRSMDVMFTVNGANMQ
jgi:copper(I)-binding protein